MYTLKIHDISQIGKIIAFMVILHFASGVTVT